MNFMNLNNIGYAKEPVANNLLIVPITLKGFFILPGIFCTIIIFCKPAL